MTDEPMEGDTQEPGRLRDMYEQAARERAEVQAELDKLRSRELFRDAGFDLNSVQHQAFQRGYTGDLTSEAVTQYANDLGIRNPPVAAPQEEKPPAPPPRDEQEALQRIAQAAMEANVIAPQPDAEDRIRKDMEAAFKRGAPKQELDRLSEELTRSRGFRTAGDWEYR